MATGKETNLGDIATAVSSALAVITSLLYVTGWAFTYQYFAQFHITLFMIDMPFPQTLIYGAITLTRWPYLLSFSLIFVIFCFIIYFSSRIGRFWTGLAVVVGILCTFWLGHYAGDQYGVGRFQNVQENNYQSLDRIRVIFKKDGFDPKATVWGDLPTTDCGRLVVAGKDRIFVVRPTADKNAALFTYMILSAQIEAIQAVGIATNCS